MTGGSSKRARTEATSAPAAPLVPLEDMTNPKQQLEMREVILVSSRDSGHTIRTSTCILFTHSKQLLNAARDLEGLLPLDCSAASMCVLEKLFWAEPWKDTVKALSNEELLDLFEVAHAWQIEVVSRSMPGWINDRKWHSQQLGDLYARAELPDGVHKAALENLIAGDDGAQIVSPRADHLCDILGMFLPRRVGAAVRYLGSAKLPLISLEIAKAVLALFELAAAQCVDVLELIDALRAIRPCPMPLSSAVLYFATRRDPEAGGVECVSLGTCIEDMLAHHLREAICVESKPNPNYDPYRCLTRYGTTQAKYAKCIPARKQWTGYLRPRT